MKKVLITLAAVLTLMSCSKEDFCGIVTDLDQPRPNVFEVQLDEGNYYRVTGVVYEGLKLNEYTCIY